MGKVCIEVNCCDDCPYFRVGVMYYTCQKLGLNGSSENLYKVCPLNSPQTENELAMSMECQKEAIVWFCISCVLTVILILYVFVV